MPRTAESQPTADALPGATVSAAVCERLPQTCPPAPAVEQVRQKLFDSLKLALLDQAASRAGGSASSEDACRGLDSAIVVYGMGGAGKSTLASALLRSSEVQNAFEGGLCWVSVGQTPDLRWMLGSLVSQLSASSAPAGSESVAALSELLESAAEEATAQGRRVLCVLDDVWDTEHARQLGTPRKAATQ